MESVQSSQSWDELIILASYSSFAIAILIFLYHEFRLVIIKDLKEKYDYVNTHEIRYFWYTVLGLILGTALYTNAVVANLFDIGGTPGILVRVFYTLAFLAVAYYVLYSLVRILYPRMVERRLTRIRNKPRISPAGNLMRKLSESEEDVHLEEDQVAQEASDLHSVDYDVWIDDKTGYKKIEKYMSYLHAEQCSECGFFTMKIVNEELEQKPTTNTTGLLLKHYQCSYCKHREAREVIIAMLSSNVK
jgi:hypothetical protein